MAGTPGKPPRDYDARAVALHRRYHGKIATAAKVPMGNFADLAVWYTPGVAAASRAVAADPEEVYALTNRANCVAIVSDGSRVLGLGDIGPAAALPVMEGRRCCLSTSAASMRCRSASTSWRPRASSTP